MGMRDIVYQQNALAKCASARVIWTAPALLAPPVIMAGVDATGLLQRLGGKKASAARLGVLLAAQGLVLRYGVPPTIALYPIKASLPAAELEPEFRGEDPSRMLFFNKGL